MLQHRRYLRPVPWSRELPLREELHLTLLQGGASAGETVDGDGYARHGQKLRDEVVGRRLLGRRDGEGGAAGGRGRSRGRRGGALRVFGIVGGRIRSPSFGQAFI